MGLGQMSGSEEFDQRSFRSYVTARLLRHNGCALRTPALDREYGLESGNECREL